MRQPLRETINVLKARAFKIPLLLLAPVLSGIFLVLAFPKYDLGWLAWVGFLPLLFALYGKRPLFGFFLAFLSGISFFSGVFYWTLQVSSYTFLHQVILIVYLGSYFGFFGFVFSFLTRRFNLTKVFLTGPFLWVSLEFIRSNMGFMAHPWPLLGHSQAPYLQVIQIASFSGVYGVSWLLVMVNSTITAFVLTILYRSNVIKPLLNGPISNRGLVSIAGAAALLTILTIGYGITVMSKPTMGKKIRVSVVQGNIEQAKKWDRSYRNYIIERYEELSRQVSKDQPSLVIWPEAATPGFVLNDPVLIKRITGLVQEMNTYFLIGSSEFPKFQKRPSKFDQYGNTALFFSPDGKVLGQYLKIHLLPFGEYLPHGETIPWSWIDVPKVTSTMPGKEFTVFQCPTFRFSANICWETVFPDMVRQFVKSGAQFVVNITNEAWFGKTAAPYHFLSSNVFRAVENRIYLVRCANTGISCFINPYGRIVERVKDASGQDIFVSGVLTETIIPMDSKTIYTRYGDWLAWLCVGCSALFLVIGFSKHKSNLSSIS